MLVVEVGFKLDKSLIYYHDMLIKNGLELDLVCISHDVYYTKNNLDNLTENQMKRSCTRIRYCDAINKEKSERTKYEAMEKELIDNNYKKVFDTTKFDFQYCNEKMKSRIQLQDIKDVGLLVYYDNPDYYDLPLKEQRNKLIDELNSYGFNFQYSDLGLDKLRTLYYGKEMFSENQGG